jgi:hypothetical protein
MWLSILSILASLIIQIFGLIEKSKLSKRQKAAITFISIILFGVGCCKSIYDVLNKPTPKAIALSLSAVPKPQHDTIHDKEKNEPEPIVSIFPGINAVGETRPAFIRNSDTVATAYFQLRVLNKTVIENVHFQIKAICRYRGLYKIMGLLKDNQTHNAINDAFIRFVEQPIHHFKKSDTAYLKLSFYYKTIKKQDRVISENYMIENDEVSDIPIPIARDVINQFKKVH